MGFMTVNELAKRWSIHFANHKGLADLGKGTMSLNGQTAKVFLCKPLTYMNDSGQAVQSIREYYHINLDHIVVIHDDMHLEFGRIKLKSGGSAGGHNGIKSIDRCLHSLIMRVCAWVLGMPADPATPTTTRSTGCSANSMPHSASNFPSSLPTVQMPRRRSYSKASRKLRINSMPDDKARHSNANRSAEETYNELMNGSLLSLRQRLLEDQAFAGLVEGHVDAGEDADPSILVGAPNGIRPALAAASAP